MSGHLPTAAVVIPCYTADRWTALVAAVASARGQTYAAQVHVSVDHNPDLAAALRAALPRDVAVLENRFRQGVSGNRNTGAFAADTDLVAFLDDDTSADPTWLERLVEAHLDAPGSVGAGGAIQPAWQAACPSWFPEEFLWAVGVTPPERRPGLVRNVWGGNMMVRRDVFTAVGGFSDSFGEVGEAPEPEDTELCLRMNAHAGVRLGWAFAPKAVVRHAVPATHSTLRYFLRRCWNEGSGKAALEARDGLPPDALGDEAAFVRTVLTRGVSRELTVAARVGRAAASRAAAIVLGTGAAGAGYASACLRRSSRPGALPVSRPRVPVPSRQQQVEQ
jgi:GT2 family glycosyltransferase